MDNFYVLLGLNPTFRYDEKTVDDRIRQLTETQLAALEKGKTEIRQIFADLSQREEMRDAFSIQGALFTVKYLKEDHKLCVYFRLPSCYGEFTVLASGQRIKTGAYDFGSLKEKCTEVGETEIGENDMPVTVITPAFSDKYYYPAVKISIGGAKRYYIIGCEENCAFVRITKTEITYEHIVVSFDWGEFSQRLYILMSKDGVYLPICSDDQVLQSADISENKRKIAGYRRGLKNLKVGLVEKTDTENWLLLKEIEI